MKATTSTRLGRKIPSPHIYACFSFFGFLLDDFAHKWHTIGNEAWTCSIRNFPAPHGQSRHHHWASALKLRKEI